MSKPALDTVNELPGLPTKMEPKPKLYITVNRMTFLSISLPLSFNFFVIFSKHIFLFFLVHASSKAFDLSN